jgi:hypothetical protein
MLDMFRQTFGIDPKEKREHTRNCIRKAMNMFSFLTRSKIPKFAKFTGNGSRTKLEHIDQFIIQCGEVSSYDIFKPRLFPLSLSSVAFT